MLSLSLSLSLALSLSLSLSLSFFRQGYGIGVLPLSLSLSASKSLNGACNGFWQAGQPYWQSVISHCAAQQICPVLLCLKGNLHLELHTCAAPCECSQREDLLALGEKRCPCLSVSVDKPGTLSSCLDTSLEMLPGSHAGRPRCGCRCAERFATRKCQLISAPNRSQFPQFRSSLRTAVQGLKF